MFWNLLEKGLVVILGIFWLGTFIAISIWGRIYYYENNVFILYTEVLMSLGILTFGLWRLIKAFRIKKTTD